MNHLYILWNQTEFTCKRTHSHTHIDVTTSTKTQLPLLIYLVNINTAYKKKQDQANMRPSLTKPGLFLKPIFKNQLHSNCCYLHRYK